MATMDQSKASAAPIDVDPTPTVNIAVPSESDEVRVISDFDRDAVLQAQQEVASFLDRPLGTPTTSNTAVRAPQLVQQADGLPLKSDIDSSATAFKPTDTVPPLSSVPIAITSEAVSEATPTAATNINSTPDKPNKTKTSQKPAAVPATPEAAGGEPRIVLQQSRGSTELHNLGKLGTNLPDLARRLSGAGGTWMQWFEKKLKVAKQAISEKLGGVDATVDEELEEKVKELMEIQTAYRNILRLALSFNDHLFSIVQVQKQMFQAFGELSIHQSELHDEFGKNHDSQKALFKNGEALLGALQFFTDNLKTLVFTTMEDTLETWRKYETSRLEFDAERHSLETLRQNPKAGKLLQKAEIQFDTFLTRFARDRESVKAKLDLLSANRTRVMRKQLDLFFEAMQAYFSGNEVALEQVLASSHLHRAQLEHGQTGNAWLEKLHHDMAVAVAPDTPALKKDSER